MEHMVVTMNRPQNLRDEGRGLLALLHWNRKSGWRGSGLEELGRPATPSRLSLSSKLY